MLFRSLAAILLGPWAAIIVMASVIGLQALLFQDGGLVVLGANITNMGLVTVGVGYVTFRLLMPIARRGTSGHVVAAGLAAWLSVVASAVACAVELGVSDTSPLSVALPAMVGVHVLIGLGEAAITAAARDGTFGILEEYQKRTPPEIQERVNRIVEQMASTFGSLAGVAVQQTLATVTSTLGFAFGFLVVPFWMFYAMRDRHFVGRTIVSTAPAEVREDVRRMLTISDRMLGRYVRAQLVLGVVVGVSVGVALALLGVDLSLGLGVWAGVTELIPIIGPWIGAIPGLIIIAATNPSLLPWVALTYLVVQQLENNLLVPRIQGQALDLHPALIIVLLVVGGAVWGFIGLVTVVPGTAILRELFWYVDRRLRGQSPDEAFAQSRLHNPALDGAPERDLEAIEAAG